MRISDWSSDVCSSDLFGLQAGLFTRDIHKVLEAWDHPDVGGIVVNDVSSYRVDNMPYGGVKDSGLGREGVRFAMEDIDRKSVVEGKRASVLVDLGGRRILKKKNIYTLNHQSSP